MMVLMQKGSLQNRHILTADQPTATYRQRTKPEQAAPQPVWKVLFLIEWLEWYPVVVGAATSTCWYGIFGSLFPRLSFRGGEGAAFRVGCVYYSCEAHNVSWVSIMHHTFANFSWSLSPSSVMMWLTKSGKPKAKSHISHELCHWRSAYHAEYSDCHMESARTSWIMQSIGRQRIKCLARKKQDRLLLCKHETLLPSHILGPFWRPSWCLAYTRQKSTGNSQEERWFKHYSYRKSQCVRMHAIKNLSSTAISIRHHKMVSYGKTGAYKYVFDVTCKCLSLHLRWSGQSPLTYSALYRFPEICALEPTW